MGYLIGLALVQWALAVAAGLVARGTLGMATAAAVNTRVAGGVIAGVGALLTLELAEGAVFAAMGIA